MNLLGQKAAFFSLTSWTDPKFIPGNPGWFTYRHFASGNFHCFAGLVNPYWGLPEPPPATHPGIHTGARFRTPAHHLSLFWPLTPVTPNNLHPRALLYHPTNRPLFPTAPRQKEKSLRLLVPGRGCFHPYRWRHRRHPIGRCRGGDVTPGSLIGQHVLSTFLLCTLSHRRRSGWHEPGWLEPGLFSLKLSLSLCSSFPPLPFSLSLLFSHTLCILLSYSLPSSITLCVEAWRFRRVSSEISAAMFSYQLEYARKNYMFAENRYFFIIRIQTASFLFSMFFKINNFFFFYNFHFHYFATRLT